MGAGVVSYTPGPGDAETWPPFAGHNHDPRAPEDDSDDTTEEAIFSVSEYMFDALMAYRSGNRAYYERILRKAVMEINGILGEAE